MSINKETDVICEEFFNKQFIDKENTIVIEVQSIMVKLEDMKNNKLYSRYQELLADLYKNLDKFLYHLSGDKHASNVFICRALYIATEIRNSSPIIRKTTSAADRIRYQFYRALIDETIAVIEHIGNIIKLTW
jgi:hypothetical protein